MIGIIIGAGIAGVTGSVLTVLGLLLWKKEKITILHDYHTDKVREEDRKIFCALSGIGLTVMGAGLLVTAVLLGITGSVYSFAAFAAGFAAGLAMLTAAGIRYNR